MLSERPAKRAKYAITIPRLPNEVLAHVWTICATEELKQARLCCSTWAYDLIGPLLFEHITLIPHLYFMERFLHTFRDSRLKTCVRKLRIDFKWAGLFRALRDKPELSAIHKVHESVPKPRLCTLSQLAEMYWAKEDREFPILSSAALSSILTLVSFLETLCVGHDIRDWFDAPPTVEALLAKYEVSDRDRGDLLWDMHSDCHPMSPRKFGWLLASALSVASPRLKKLGLGNFDPMQFLEYPDPNEEGEGEGDEDDGDNEGGEGEEDDEDSNVDSKPCSPYLITLLADAFEHLSHLDIRLLDDSHWKGDEVMALALAQATAQILITAESVSSIRLDCNWNVHSCIEYSPWFRYAEESRNPLPVLSCYLNTTDYLHGLKTLWLEAVICQEKVLEEFLTTRCPQLDSLTLGNCIITPQETGGLGCWIALVKRLRHKLPLTAVNFVKLIGNFGQQHWHIAEHMAISKDCVKARMIEWFLDKHLPDDACPLNIFEVQRLEKDVRKADEVLQETTDESWSMNCSCPPLPKDAPLHGRVLRDLGITRE